MTPWRAVARWWRNARLWVKGALVLALPVIALLAMGTANLVVANQLDHLSSSTSATTASIVGINHSLELALDAETGVRGYAATGNPVFLQPYNQAIAALRPLRKAKTIDGLTPQETARLRTLGRQAIVVLATVKNGVADGTLHGTALETQLLDGKHIEDQLRTTITAAQDRERQALAEQQSQVTNAQDAANIINIVGMIVGILAGLLAMVLLLRGIIRRVTSVNRNTERFLAGQPMDLYEPTKDEIGHLETVLLGAADLVTRREQELQAARDEAVAATRAKDTFLGRMSHELRTPLTAILGFGQLLQMEDLAADDADSADHIVSAGEHLLALIEDLLDISRIETDHLSLSLEPILLGDVVDESVSLLRPQATARDVTVDIVGVGPGVVQADRQRLKQVVLNLVSNAIKYNRVGGTVAVAWRPGPASGAGAGSATTVELVVEDTGIGILAENVDRLFDPFDRLGAEATGVEGAGVGLSLSKALTEAMRGTIDASSERGRGSTFTVTLPAAELPAGELPPTPRPGSIDRPRSAITNGPRPDDSAGRTTDAGIVLYAEDNLASLGVIERVFARRPETLEVAIQGKMVLDLAKVVQPVLVVLDLHLPDLSGEDVLRELKANPATAAIPVVILSASATEGHRRRLLDGGALAYLTKPLNVPEFLALLDRVVDG
jgi:signal transduction histidine kinase/CheY-like chemotaxis protein